MKASIKKQIGVTILEVMLVLAIASSFIIITIRMYEQYRLQVSQAQLLGNVDQLFQAMTHYYQANCRRQLDISGNIVSAGALDPLVAGSGPVVLSINSHLLSTGFLNSWQPDNVLVDNTPAEKGYYVQFNQAPTGTMNVYACTGSGDPPSCTSNPQTTALNGIGTPTPGTSAVTVWRMQVAVKLRDPTKQTQYMLQMGASCVSTAGSSNGPVTMCENSPGQNGYLVWERAATFVSGNTSDLWLSEPQVKQFNMQYTNDSMQLLNGSAQTWTSTTAQNQNTQNYLCGE